MKANTVKTVSKTAKKDPKTAPKKDAPKAVSRIPAPLEGMEAFLTLKVKETDMDTLLLAVDEMAKTKTRIKATLKAFEAFNKKPDNAANKKPTEKLVKACNFLEAKIKEYRAAVSVKNSLHRLNVRTSYAVANFSALVKNGFKAVKAIF